MFINRTPLSYSATRELGAKQRRGCLLAAVALGILSLATQASAAELWPQTKVRLTVIQWVPIKGIYERWDALSGEYMVTGDGTMPLPVIGPLATKGKASDEIAAEVATALKERLGLVSLPDTSIEIVSYPPIYVVGEVSAPGAFEYRPGMSVLQAFAMGGGMRQSAATSSSERVRLAAELHLLEDNLLRAHARIARLRAETGGLETIAFPPAVTEHPDAGLAQAAMAEEQAILSARKREMARQAESLAELVTLLNQEIDTLTIRLEDVDKAIASAETELGGVQSLVEKGMATVSRRSDLERDVADLRFDRLTQTTAILRARQTLNQANREALQLADARATQGALSLQEEQAKLSQMLLQQSTAQRLLLAFDSGLATAGEAPVLSYTIVRPGPTGPHTMPADETTELWPGDVLKVTTTPVVPGTAATTATAQAQP